MVDVQNTEYNVNFILRSNPRRTIFNSAPVIQLNKKSYNDTYFEGFLENCTNTLYILCLDYGVQTAIQYT
jgi:hypothetical protein